MVPPTLRMIRAMDAVTLGSSRFSPICVRTSCAEAIFVPARLERARAGPWLRSGRLPSLAEMRKAPSGAAGFPVKW